MIEVSGLSKSFGDVRAVGGVSFVAWLTENLPFRNSLAWAAEGDERAVAVAGIWVLALVGLAGALFIRRNA